MPLLPLFGGACVSCPLSSPAVLFLNENAARSQGGVVGDKRSG